MGSNLNRRLILEETNKQLDVKGIYTGNKNVASTSVIKTKNWFGPSENFPLKDDDDDDDDLNEETV